MVICTYICIYIYIYKKKNTESIATVSSQYDAAIDAKQRELDQQADELRQLASDHKDSLESHQYAHECDVHNFGITFDVIPHKVMWACVLNNCAIDDKLN